MLFGRHRERQECFAVALDLFKASFEQKFARLLLREFEPDGEVVDEVVDSDGKNAAHQNAVFMNEDVVADARSDVDEQSSLFFFVVGEGSVSGGDTGKDGLDFLFESEFADGSAHGVDFCAFGENDMDECVEAACAVSAGIFDAGVHVEHEIRGE